MYLKLSCLSIALAVAAGALAKPPVLAVRGDSNSSKRLDPPAAPTWSAGTYGPADDAAAADPNKHGEATILAPTGAHGSLGVRRGDLDRHFGPSVAYPGRAAIAFDIGADIDDRAFGMLTMADDSVVLIGRAGTLVNGTRLALTWLRPDGRLATERLTAGRQTLNVTWTANSELVFTKAVGVHGMVGAVFLNRFYLVGRLELTATADGDIDFVAMCLRYNGTAFEACPDFGPFGNGMARVAFDLGAPNFRKDIPYDLFVDRNNIKLLLAGSAQWTAADSDFAVARLDLFNGTLDTSFATTGKVSIPFDLSATPADEATSIHVRPIDNRIVVGGRANVGLFVFRSAMAQLQSNGLLDTAFCAPAVSSCQSPASHRSGRRLWEGEQTLAFSQVVSLLGGDLAAADTVVVREQVLGATSGRGIVSRVAADGGCSICSEPHLSNFERIRPVAATLDYRFIPPFLFDFGVVVAAYGIYSGNSLRYTHVFRIRSDMQDDAQFSSGPIGVQQIIEHEVANGELAVSEPSAITQDSRGRYLVAGSRRWRATGNDWDFALARLQNDVILVAGFDY